MRNALAGALGAFAAFLAGFRLSLRPNPTRAFTAPALHGSEAARLMLMAQYSRDATIFCGLDRRILWVNRPFEILTGYKAEDVVGLSPGAVLQFEDTDPDTVARIRTALDAGLPVNVELQNRSRDGDVYWIDLDIQPTFDETGRPTGFIGTQRDISAYKAAERRITESERLLAAVIDGTNVGTWIWNVTTSTGSINERGTAILGHEADALNPTTQSSWQSLVHPDDLERAQDLQGRHRRGETPYYECELRMRHKNGSWIWIHDRGRVASWTEDGQPHLMAGTLQDITERKQAEQRIIDSERMLAAVIEGTDVGTWTWDVPTRRGVCNERVAAIVGYTAAEFGPLTGERWDRLVHPDDLLRARDIFDRHIRRELPLYDCEIRLLHKDGHWVWVHDCGRVVRWSDDGAAQLTAGTIQDISARKLAEQRIIESERTLAAVIEGTNVGTWTWNVATGAGIFNPRGAEILGYRLEELEPISQETWERLCHPDDFAVALALLDRHHRRETPFYEHEMRMKHKDGHWVWVQDRGRVATWLPDGSPLLMAGTIQDISARKKNEAELIESRNIAERKTRELEIILAHMNQGLSVFDENGLLLLWNEQYREMFRIEPDMLKVGTPFAAVLEQLDLQLALADDPDVSAAEFVEAMTHGRELRAHFRMKDDRIISTIALPLPMGGWVATHEDVTERELHALRIAHAAHHDVLTGLANRAEIKKQIASDLRDATIEAQPLSILLIDLDRFKAVNDTFGHAAGDKLLQEVARRMSAVVREGDIVARLGGDEFAILHRASRNQREASSIVATRLIDALSAPYRIDGRDIRIGASIGIALAPQHGMDVDTLLRNADSALYSVKASGRNGFRFFDSELAAKAAERRQIETSLRDAISERQFTLVYQPIAALPDRTVVGVEALLRWHHPVYGNLPPDLFIPIAEESGLIVPIGEWVIDQACRDAARWEDDITVSVNVSPAQLGKGNLVDTVTRALLRSRLDPRRFVIEVTETVFLRSDDQLLDELRQLQDLGIRIALDDFGTGYSSLSYIRLFPFDKIKIDKSFVADIASNAHCAAIVCAVASLAGSLGIETTAEGVETEEQLQLLMAAGCGEVQGYLLSRPMKIDDLAPRLASVTMLPAKVA